MARQSFRVSGRVINRTTRRGVGGLRVEAWDRDIKHNDPLGSAITDDSGTFAIVYDRSRFDDEPRRQRPDLFFKVFRKRTLLATTASMPIENAGRRRTVKIEVDLDLAASKEAVSKEGAPKGGARKKGEKTTATTTRTGGDRATRGGAGSARKASPNDPVMPVPVDPDPVKTDPNQPSQAPLTGSLPEVSMHELGESVAAALANVQQELDRYQSPLGAFVVDEIDLTIPAQMRVDELGQMMVIVTSPDGTTPADASQIRLRIKPVLGSHNDPLMAGTQPLSDVTALGPEFIDVMKSARVFTVNDFRRVTRTPQGKLAVQSKLGWGDDEFRQVFEQIKLLSLPVLPVAVSSLLTRKLRMRGIPDFLQYDSSAIADMINADSGQGKEGSTMVTPEHVDCWKDETRTYIAIKPPCATTAK